MPPPKKVSIWDIARAIAQPEVLEAIESLKKNRHLFEEMDLGQMKADLESYAKMLKLTYKHQQVALQILRKLHPEEFKAALDEVNAKWRASGDKENLDH